MRHYVTSSLAVWSLVLPLAVQRERKHASIPDDSRQAGLRRRRSPRYGTRALTTGTIHAA